MATKKVRSINLNHGEAMSGMAMQGLVVRGDVGQGAARPGRALFDMAFLGSAMQVRERNGEARQGIFKGKAL